MKLKFAQFLRKSMGFKTFNISQFLFFFAGKQAHGFTERDVSPVLESFCGKKLYAKKMHVAKCTTM